MAKKLFVVVVVVLAVLALVGCGGGNDIAQTMRTVAQEQFLPDEGATKNVDGKPMTRPEAVVFWANEVAKLQVCESTATKNGVVYINAAADKSTFSFVTLNGKAECGMSRPWSPVLNSLLKSGAYSTKQPPVQSASKNDSVAQAMGMLALQLAAFLKKGGKVTYAMRVAAMRIVLNYNYMCYWTVWFEEETGSMAELDLSKAITFETSVLDSIKSMRAELDRQA